VIVVWVLSGVLGVSHYLPLSGCDVWACHGRGWLKPAGGGALVLVGDIGEVRTWLIAGAAFLFAGCVHGKAVGLAPYDQITLPDGLTAFVTFAGVFGDK